MPRSSIIGTSWRPAWGTMGTQGMKPSPFIEGLGSYTERIDDGVCFLAFQDADIVFAEDAMTQYSVGSTEFSRMEVYHVYYNGYSPQFLFAYTQAWGGFAGNPAAATLSLRMGGLDFGTMTTITAGATNVDWYIDVPESLPAGRHKFEIYGASDHNMHGHLSVRAWWLTLLPTRLF